MHLYFLLQDLFIYIGSFFNRAFSIIHKHNKYKIFNFYKESDCLLLLPRGSDRKKMKERAEMAEFLGWLLIMFLTRRKKRVFLLAPIELSPRRMRKINKMNQQTGAVGRA